MAAPRVTDTRATRAHAHATGRSLRIGAWQRCATWPRPADRLWRDACASVAVVSRAMLGRQRQQPMAHAVDSCTKGACKEWLRAAGRVRGNASSCARLVALAL